MRYDGGQRAVFVEHALPGQQPVADAAEAVDVDAAVDVRLAQRHLGRHKRGRSCRHTFGRELRRAGLEAATRLDQAEVEHFDEVVVEAQAAGVDVRRLDVAVDQVSLMGLGQRMTDLPQQMHGARRRDGPEPLHQHIEIQPFEKLHHIVERAVRGDPEVIEFNGVIRVERRGGPGFALEAAQYGPANPLVGAEDLRTDQLDGRRAGEHPVPRHPDLAHTAFTQRLHELIAADLPRPV